jgi:16S rRNA (guanine966-N2)-methyltransferase
MRIVGGVYKSRLISMPKGVEIRPTQDRVREAIFNLLGDMSGMRVLELFAGSGAIGIEAISRGAAFVTFVDNNFRCVEAVRSNLKSLQIADSRYGIIRANALSVISRLSKSPEKYDILFLDPPYYEGLAKKCLINIDSHDILSPNSTVIAEHFKKDILTTDLKSLVFEQERRYGDTVVSIYRKVA